MNEISETPQKIEEENNDPDSIEFWLLLFKSLSRKEIDAMLQVVCWSEEFRVAFRKAYRIYDANQLIEKEDTKNKND